MKAIIIPKMRAFIKYITKIILSLSELENS